jgi:cellulose synthase/poly-beta-1,6-N-acetylglucosamine synthase-like glycosyltransferase
VGYYIIITAAINLLINDLVGLIGVILITIPSTIFFLIYAVFYHYGKRYVVEESESTEIGDAYISIIMPVRREPFDLIDDALRHISGWNIRDHVEVLIVSDDDYDDYLRIRKLIDKWRSKGLRVFLIWRSIAKGFRTGALNTGLYASNGEYVYVMDVDSRINESFIVKAINIMRNDERVAAVVARWCGKNSDTRIAEAVSASMKFVVDALYRGRSALRLPVFPVGTGTLYRSSVLKNILRGWDEERIQDDMEIGCRIMRHGYKIIFLDNEKVYVEVPRRYRSLRIQQERWAYGATDAAIARFKDILKAPLPWYAKLEAYNYLLQYMPILLILIGFILVSYAGLASGIDSFNEYWYLGIPWIFSAALYIMYYIDSLSELGYNYWKALVNGGRSAGFTTTLTPILSYALIKAFLRRRVTYKRTPKGLHEKKMWGGRYRVPVEIITGLTILITSLLLIFKGILYTGLWSLFYGIGYLYGIIRWGKEMFYK